MVAVVQQKQRIENFTVEKNVPRQLDVNQNKKLGNPFFHAPEVEPRSLHSNYNRFHRHRRHTCYH